MRHTKVRRHIRRKGLRRIRVRSHGRKVRYSSRRNLLDKMGTIPFDFSNYTDELQDEYDPSDDSYDLVPDEIRVPTKAEVNAAFRSSDPNFAELALTRKAAKKYLR